MKTPRNMDELAKLTTENTKITGYGAKTTMISPCPFCAYPNFMRWPILDMREVASKGAVCFRCKRGARLVFEDYPDGGAGFEIVQTEGPDQPEWFQPKMRRVEPGPDIPKVTG